MLRSRLLIGRLQRKQGLMVNSFYVLREGLINFKKFAEGLFSGIEKGEESDGKGSLQLPEIYGGANAAFASQVSAGKKGAPAGKAPAKAPAKGKEE